MDSIDTKNKKIRSLEGEELSYDVAVVIPYHEGPKIEFVPSHVKDDNGYIKIDKYTGQIVGYDDAFAIGIVVVLLPLRVELLRISKPRSLLIGS